MKSKKSVLLSLVLLVVTALALIGLFGCGIITGREGLTPEQPVSEEEQPPPAEPPSEEQPLPQAPPVEVQIAFLADPTNLRPGECATLQWDVQGGEVAHLNGQPVDLSGQMEVCPQETTAYSLAVYVGVGPPAPPKAEREVVISVEGTGQPPASPAATSVPPATVHVTVLRDLEYARYELDGQEHALLLDLYLPEQNASKPFPLLIYIHGGGWIEGSKDNCPGATFAQRGYAMACVDYRLADFAGGCPQARSFPAQIHDVKAAVRWLRGHAEEYGLDPERFGAMGDSSGGHLAALLGTSHTVAGLEGPANLGVSDAVQAVCDWYGPADVTQSPPTIVFEDDPCQVGLDYLNATYGGEETPYFYWTLAWGTFLGGSLADPVVLERAAQATPLTYVDAGEPPFLVIHGEDDAMVPIAQSELLVAALKQAGVEVTFVRLPDVGHGFSGPPGSDQEVDPAFLEPALEFFDRHLKAPSRGETAPEVISAPSELTWVRLGGPPGGLGYDIRMRPDNPDIMFVTDANAGIHKSTDGGRTWFSVNEGITPMGNGIYPVFSATIDPHDYDTVWIGTQNIGHVYRSTDSGQTWEERDEGIVENGRSVRGITVDPNNPNIVYAGVEVSSYAWRGEPFARRQDLVQGEVYKSTDAGRSWTRIWVGNNLARYIWVDPRNSNRIYVSTGIFDRDAADSDVPNRVWGGVGILRSDNGGQTWTVLDEDNGLGGRYIPSLFMHPTNPDILLAAVTGTGDTPGAYVTYDGGDTWQLVLAVPEGFGVEAVEISTSHPDVWYVAAEGQIWRSDDAGQTWQHFMLGTQDRAAGLPIDLQVDPRDPYRIFDNNYGGSNFLSTDGGATWVDASQGYTGNKLVFNIATVPDNPWRVFAGDFYSEDGGTTWFGAEFKGAAAFAFIADPQTQATHVIVGGSNGSVWHSRDGGQTWEGEVKVVDLMAEVAAGRIKTDVMPMRALAIAPSDTREAYAGFAHGTCLEAMIMVKCFEATPGLHRSHDGGYTWEKVSGTPFVGVGILTLAVHPDDSKVLYAGTATGLYLSRDGGDTWQHLASLDAVTHQVPIVDLDLFPVELEASLVRDVKFDPFDANVLYVASTPGGVYRSDDGGNTWRQVAAGMDPNEPVFYLLPDPNRPGVIYASSAFSGVFVTTDGAQTWRRLAEGLTVSNVRGLALSADGAVLYAGTVGGGMFRLGKPAGPPPQAGPIAEPSPISTEPAPLPTPPTATPQIAAFPPKPTPEPQARGAIRGRGICPGMAALPLALAGLVWVNRRRR